MIGVFVKFIKVVFIRMIVMSLFESRPNCSQ